MKTYHEMNDRPRLFDTALSSASGGFNSRIPFLLVLREKLEVVRIPKAVIVTLDGIVQASPSVIQYHQIEILRELAQFRGLLQLG
jgi:hypothetical protein